MLCFFNDLCVGVSRKVGLLKRRVRSHVVRGEIKNCTPLWRNTFWSENVQCTKHHMLGGTFGSSDVEKLHAAVGEKHILKWKCTKHHMLGALFEVLMSKNCTPLWREAHLEVKMYKTRQLRSTLKFWCWKIAWTCGEKRICQSRCAKYLCFGALFQVQMSNN